MESKPPPASESVNPMLPPAHKAPLRHKVPSENLTHEAPPVLILRPPYKKRGRKKHPRPEKSENRLNPKFRPPWGEHLNPTCSPPCPLNTQNHTPPILPPYSLTLPAFHPLAKTANPSVLSPLRCLSPRDKNPPPSPPQIFPTWITRRLARPLIWPPAWSRWPYQARF